MSGLLLDSHVLYNFALGKPQIGPETLDLLNSAQRLLFSSMTVLELNIKHLLGKFEDIEPFVSAIKQNGIIEILLSSDAIFRLKDFPQLSSHDPFDRAILAQAMELGVPLVTADRRLVSLGLKWVKDARK